MLRKLPVIPGQMFGSAAQQALEGLAGVGTGMWAFNPGVVALCSVPILFIFLMMLLNKGLSVSAI